MCTAGGREAQFTHTQSTQHALHFLAYFISFLSTMNCCAATTTLLMLFASIFRELRCFAILSLFRSALGGPKTFSLSRTNIESKLKINNLNILFTPIFKEQTKSEY